MDNDKFIVSDTYIPIPLVAKDPLSILGKIFIGHMVSDRFGILNDDCFFRMFNDESVVKPKKYERNYSFAKLIENRAKTLLNKYKSISVVCPKGNLNDATVLLALVSSLNEDNILTVYITDCAYNNNPILIDYLNNSNVVVNRVADIDLWDDVGESNCDAILTSFGGTFFVSGYHSLSVDDNELLNPWNEVLTQILQNMVELDNEDILRVLDACESYADYFDVELTSFDVLARIMSWGLSRQQTAYISQTKIAEYPSNRNKAISFFDDETFDRWVLKNLENDDYTIEDQRNFKLMSDYVKSFINNSEVIVTESKCQKPEKKSVKLLTDNGFKRFTLTDGSITCKVCASKIFKRIRKYFKKETND